MSCPIAVPRGCVKWLIIAIVRLEVIACAKGLARSTDNGHSDIGISVVGLKRAVQLPSEDVIQRIPSIWAIECDARDIGPWGVNDDVLVISHG